MKKFLCSLMICVLLFGTFTACGTAKIPTATAPEVDYPPKIPEITDVEPLTDEMVAKIEAAWRDKYGYDLKWFNEDNLETRHFGMLYVGVVDGYTVLFKCKGGSSGHLQIKPLASYEVHTSVSGYVYKDGEISPLNEISFNYAEAKTILDRFMELDDKIFQMDDLYDPYVTVLGDTPSPLEECPYSEEDLLAAIGATEEYNPFEGSTYLGTYHGCIVFVSKNMWDEYGNGIIAGVAYDRGQDTFWIVRNGESCSLEDAFEYGYLTVDDIRTIMYYRYGERVPQR